MSSKVINDPNASELLKQVGVDAKLDKEVRADMKAIVTCNVYAECGDVTGGQAKWHQLKKGKYNTRFTIKQLATFPR